MGVVLKAYDPHLDRHVAIKILQPHLYHGVGTSDARDRMLREAKAMAKVRHANVITVYSVGTVRKQVYIAMEFIAGGTLQEWSVGGKHEWREILATYTKSGHGLSAAHKSGLVHRDFKPANVLMDEGGRVLVTDFGLVSSDSLPSDIQGQPRNSIEMPAVQALSVSLTQTGTILGTPPYMAPEQHRGDAINARADQFAFCVALYEALYGERPHEGGNYSILAGNILSGRIRDTPPGSSVPAWLRQILLRGLSVDADDRFESMDALLEALGNEPAQPRASWRGRRAAAGLTACIIGVVVAFAWPRAETTPSPANAIRTPIPTPLVADEPEVEGAAQIAAEATREGHYVFLTSTPPEVDLYRKHDGVYFGTTPLFLAKSPSKDSCVDLVAKRAGFGDSENWTRSRCGRRLTGHIQVGKDPKNNGSRAKASRDSEPCRSARVKLSLAREKREVNRLSEAWSIVSQCYANNERPEEAAIAMGRVSAVFEEKEYVSDEAKREESAKSGALNFRLAKSHWAQGTKSMGLLKARRALMAFRAAKSDQDAREVKSWIDERGSLQDLTLEARGYSKDVETLEYGVVPGKAEVASNSFPSGFHAGHSESQGILYGGIDLYTQPSFSEMPAGEYTICAQAENDRKVTAFRCKVVQHGGAAGTHFVIDLQAISKPGGRVSPSTKPAVAPPPPNPQDKEVKSLLARAQKQLDTGQYREASNSAMRAYKLKKQPMSYAIKVKAHCHLSDLSNATGALRNIPKSNRALRSTLRAYCKKLGANLP
jgi:hypothetical protein